MTIDPAGVDRTVSANTKDDLIDTNSLIAEAASLINVLDTYDDEGDASVRQAFDYDASNALRSSYHYEHVSVLLVQWDPSLDPDLQCGPEVEQLRSLFADSFNYHTTVLTLHDRRSPQLQLELGINRLVDEHDGPHRSHLLILYYSGHGQSCNGRFNILPGRLPSEHQSALPDHIKVFADWTKATQNIKHEAEADVLMIVDACFAGVMAKGTTNQMRVVEALLATGRNGIAPAPGPKSMTTGMIQALEALLQKGDAFAKEQFNTYDLRISINRIQNGENTRIEPIIGPMSSHRFIKLVPLRKRLQYDTLNGQSTSEDQESPLTSREASTLTVRFSFSNLRSLDLTSARKFAYRIAETCRKDLQDFEVSNVEWVEFARSDPKMSMTQVLASIRALKRMQNYHLQKQACKKRLVEGTKSHDTGRSDSDLNDNAQRGVKRPRTSPE